MNTNGYQIVNRLVWADSLKGWLILLVIMGHCIASTIGNDAANTNYWWCLIYSFHMPAFIAISGYLSYRGTNHLNVRGGVSRRFQQLMVPFLVWSVIKYAVNGKLPYCYHSILQPTNTFWFLWALFFIVVLFSIFDWLSNKIKIRQEVIMSLACICCAGTMVVFKDIRILGIQYILYYFIFYCLGYYINKYQLLTNKTWLILLLLFVWFVMGSFWRPHELPKYISLTGELATMCRFIYKFAVALVAISAIFSLAPLTLNRKNRLNEIICQLGSISLGIYTFHLTFVGKICEILRLVCRESIFVVWISFILITVLSYFVVILIGKYKLPARCLLGKL